MEKKTVYCDCEKKPGGILEITGEIGHHMIHVKCGKEIGPFPPVRKPVYCAHPRQVSRLGQTGTEFCCGACGILWPLGEAKEDMPQVVIGYVEEEK